MTSTSDATQGFSIGALARQSGVSVRTLHHYDAIGLLSPSNRTFAGYRVYGPDDVERLSHILAYRACGLALTDIADLLDGSHRDRAAHLRHQLTLLDRRLSALADQRSALVRALEAHEMGINLDPTEIVEIFGGADPTEYAEEAGNHWGDTEAYRQSQARTASYGKEEWIAAQAEADAVVAEFVECLVGGEPADGPRAGAAVVAHRTQITRWYYECSPEIQQGLAQMYIADPRFTAYYDNHAPGLAQYIHDAITSRRR